MRTVDYTDDDGRSWRVQLPDELGDDMAHMGIPVGPPDLSSLGLHSELLTRLHNELFRRGIITYADALKRQPEILAAWQAALKVDALEVMRIYANENSQH